MTPPKILISSLSKRYGATSREVLALEAVDLSVSEGEFVTIVGPSGCGKSTLLYILGGFLKGTGTVAIDGRAVDRPGLDRGIVFQEYALFPWLTVKDNIGYGLQTQNIARSEREDIVHRYIELIGLRGFEQRFPRELSGGMKQRVALARTLACEPEILLLDEPFGALDAQTREIMQDELLRLWRKTRKTVLMVTHDVTEAVYLSTRCASCLNVLGALFANFRSTSIVQHRGKKSCFLRHSSERAMRSGSWFAHKS